jgi:hypothetical protein
VASAHSATHTLKFTALQKATIPFTKTTQGTQETDVSSTGKAIGFDMIYLAIKSSTAATANITGDFSGGFLYGTASVNLKPGVIANGKVTGGTGAFQGATGTIKVKAISNTKHAITITYSN